MTAADTIRDIDVKLCPECGARFGKDAAFCPFDGIQLALATWDPTRDPLVGTMIDGRYEVHEPLGEGGMGSVYRVRHIALERLFAMKVLRRDLAADKALAARFVQEARATAAIKHPGVVAISDFGELPEGLPYFVMELLDGETLATRIRARGPMSPSMVITIAKQICAALQASHDAGVVHRDLKPENVFLVGKKAGKAAEEQIRIVDFGAAKVVGGSKLTRPGVVFGTPYYMSPEQAGGQAVDGRADIYSLGVLMYEMLTGTVPFEADTYMGVLTKHMFAEPARPSEKIASGVSLGDLEGVVMRALEKDPAARYGSMTELADALERARKAGPSAAPPSRDPSKRSVAPPGLSTADRIELSVAKRIVADERARRNRVIFVAAITAVVTVGAGGLLVAAFTPGPKPTAAMRVPVPVTATATASAPASATASASATATASAAASASAPASAPASVTASASAAVPATARPVTMVAAPKWKPPPPAPAPAAPPAAPTRRLRPDELPDPWAK